MLEQYVPSAIRLIGQTEGFSKLASLVDSSQLRHNYLVKTAQAEAQLVGMLEKVGASLLSSLKMIKAEELAKNLLRGGAMGVGAAVPLGALGAMAYDDAKETTSSAVNKALLSGLGVAAGGYGLSQLLRDKEKTSSAKNHAEITQKLAAAGSLNYKLRHIYATTGNADAKKMLILGNSKIASLFRELAK